MADVVFAIGATVAVTLIALLLVTMVVPAVRIWPTPGAGSWQYSAFWPLFRGLNVLCFAMAAADVLTGRAPLLGLPVWLRGLAFVALLASVALFVYAFRVLGRDNSYGARDGLVTAGIYRWTRNPQNAMLVLVYGCLAVAADTASTYVLSAAMMAVYTLMILLEEPWLSSVYGEPYRRYCRRVPRFFKWRRAAVFARAWIGGRFAGRCQP